MDRRSFFRKLSPVILTGTGVKLERTSPKPLTYLDPTCPFCRCRYPEPWRDLRALDSNPLQTFEFKPGDGNCACKEEIPGLSFRVRFYEEVDG